VVVPYDRAPKGSAHAERGLGVIEFVKAAKAGNFPLPGAVVGWLMILTVNSSHSGVKRAITCNDEIHKVMRTSTKSRYQRHFFMAHLPVELWHV